MALRGEIVDFGRLRFLNQADQIGGVGHVAVVQEKFGVLDVRIDIQVIDALGVERRRAAFDAMHDVAFRQQQFGEIGAILAGDPGD